MTKIKSPRVLRSLLPAVLVGALAVGGWYCYAWVLPGRTGPANSDKVSKASGIARTELDRRLAETLATLLGHPELLGDATLDRCLWSGSFEGAKAGEINCQRMQARYVAVEGAPAEVAGQWKAALESRGWSGSSAPLPPGTGYTAVRDHYNDPSNQDFLSVTLVGDRASMALLDNDIPLGGSFPIANLHRRQSRPEGVSATRGKSRQRSMRTGASPTQEQLRGHPARATVQGVNDTMSCFLWRSHRTYYFLRRASGSKKRRETCNVYTSSAHCR
ncbi:hypothetical protein GCM10020229_34980 [Kitasatospora albolonga]|uniref:hypothetical protein n=1 Tax=Kitasatospora albolonga TaxID=68173 RepID=UPI0031EA97AE